MKEDENVVTTESNHANEACKQTKMFQRRFLTGGEIASSLKSTINLNSNFFKGTRTKQLGFSKLSKDKPVAAEEGGVSSKKADGDLTAYVTKIKEFKGLSQYSLAQPKPKAKVTSVLSNKFPQRRPYFFDEFVAAHVSDTNDNYFYNLHKMSMTQTLQSFKILASINPKTYAPNGVPVTLPPPMTCPTEPPYSPASGPIRKTIIFDLDETLIHCNEDQLGPSDLRVPVIFPTGEKIMAGINIRPHSKEVLEELANHFEVVIFTASHSCYANPVVDFFDDKKIISARLFRENCSQVGETVYTKDLSIIRNRDLKNVVLVDNMVYSFILNLGNGIPIIPYYNNKRDTELLKLRDFLMELKHVDDVRPFVAKYFEWETFQTHAHEPEMLYKRLFES
jgi:Dullard-like phosphatase family protein